MYRITVTEPDGYKSRYEYETMEQVTEHIEKIEKPMKSYSQSKITIKEVK